MLLSKKHVGPLTSIFVARLRGEPRPTIAASSRKPLTKKEREEVEGFKRKWPAT
jgi:hypothetical protein